LYLWTENASTWRGEQIFGRYGEWVMVLATLVLGFGFLRFLYRRKIFLRV